MNHCENTDQFAAAEHLAGTINRKCRDQGIEEFSVRAFLRAVSRYRSGASGWIREHEIQAVDSLPDAGNLPPATKPNTLLKQLAIVKLNGGLGTSMGLDSPKSLLPIKEGNTFLDLIARQVLDLRRGARAPLFYLMNSFHSREASLSQLRRYAKLVNPDGLSDFVQNQVPKLDARTLMPVAWPADPALEWCPPGHGDLYPSLAGSGLLDRLLERNVRFLFVSNADNLGATADPALLEYFSSSGADFMMETARRTPADRKGGHLARRRSDGKLILRELAQCAPEEQDQFQNTERYAWFNTNNLWIRLDRLHACLERKAGLLDLPVIPNRKTLDPGDSTTPEVLQLESAMGSAIECFDSTLALAVPRSRFAPVKTTSDLLAVRSNAYRIGDGHRIVLDPSRNGRPPVVILNPRFFRLLSEFENRCNEGVPSLVDCERLEVSGDLAFSQNVICRGQVRFVRHESGTATIPSGRYSDQTVDL